MSEIKIGEYVRTKDGRIEKVKEINKYGVVTKYDNNDDTFSTEVNWYTESGREINKEDILEHSFKIIDLLYKGDYVNNDIVDDIVFSDLMGENRIHLKSGFFLDEQFIRRIITKEKLKKLKK